MTRSREHIHRLRPFEVITACAEDFYVAREGGGIAGDIADDRHFGFDEGCKQGLVRALSGGIEDGCVKALAGGDESRNFLRGVGADKAGVGGKAVGPGVALGIFNGRGDDFDAHRVVGMPGSGEGDGARAAVGVENARLAAFGKPGSFEGLGVQLLRLNGIDLEKGLGRKLKLQPQLCIG